MKPRSMSRTNWLVVAVLTALTLTACATQKASPEREQALTQAVSDRQWHIDISTMSTLRYGMRSVTPDFFLELRGDTLCSYLPYLGQAYQAPMSSPPQGLNFTVPVQNYQLKHPRRSLAQIEMDVRTDEDYFHYMIDVYASGQAHIHVRSLNRDPISFDGFFDIRK